jgi:hypothetical protein
MPGHSTHTANLLRILQQECLLLQRLVELSEAESEAILANDIARLSTLELELRQRLEEQEALETSRLLAVRDLAFALNLEGLPAFTTLLSCVSAREREILTRLRAQILDAQARLDALTKRNRALLNNVLEYVRFSLAALTEAALSPARYGTNLASISAPTFYIDSKA